MIGRLFRRNPSPTIRAGDQRRLLVAGGQMLAQWLKASCCGAKPILRRETNRDGRIGSKGEILASSRCGPLFPQQQT